MEKRAIQKHMTIKFGLVIKQHGLQTMLSYEMNCYVKFGKQ